MLAVRSWTGYELTRQIQRSLRYMWRTSEGHLYREQKRLVELGWAAVESEPAGQRSRNRYAITDAGRVALAEWLDRPPEEPHFQVEGILRTFFGDQGTHSAMLASMEATAASARTMLDEMLEFVEDYLAEGGPLDMLEAGTGGSDARLEFRGRPMYPERLPAVSMAIDVTTQLLETIETFFSEAAIEVAGWQTADPQLTTEATRRRLERIREERAGPSGG